MFIALRTFNEDLWNAVMTELLDEDIEYERGEWEYPDGTFVYYIKVYEADVEDALDIVDEVTANFER